MQHQETTASPELCSTNHTWSKKFYHISQGTKFLIWLPVSENFNEQYCSDV